MRIGLIADTHIPEARRELWPQVFDAFTGVDLILHAGDIHEVRLIDELARVAPVYVARGDGDDGGGGRPVQPEHPMLKPGWTLELGGLLVGITHALPIPEMPPRLTVAGALGRLFPERRPDVVIYGDSHVEAIDTIDGVLCVNPGSPTFPHNLETQLGTIGFLEIAGGELPRASASIWRLTAGGIEPFDWATWRRAPG
jgi:putative phosphoesterase